MKKKQVPKWQYFNGKESTFALIHSDLVLSEPFKKLSSSAKRFYYDCRINASRSIARKSLAKHLREDMEANGMESDVISMEIDRKLNEGYFVMPADHLKLFGYSRQQGYNMMLELQRGGFVEKVECNKHRKKENVYKFSTNFKEPEKLKKYVEWLEKTIEENKKRRKKD